MALKVDIFSGILKGLTIKLKSALFVGISKISNELVFSGEIGEGETIDVYDLFKSVNPGEPDRTSQIRIERVVDSDSCFGGEATLFTQSGVLINPEDLFFCTHSVGVFPENPDDIGEFLGTVQSGFNYIDFDGGLGNGVMFNLGFLNNEIVFGAEINNLVGQENNRTLLASPDQNVTFEVNGRDETAQVNGVDVCLKERGFVGSSRYTIERAPNGDILKIDQWVESDPGVSGVRVVDLPFTLPDDMSSRVDIQVTGIATSPAVADACYQDESLTTTALSIEVYDGAGVSSTAAALVHLTWVLGDEPS